MGRADAELFAVQRHLVPANLIRAVDRTDDLRAPRADQTDQSQDLALVQRKADVVELVRIQIFDLQQRLTDEARSEGILIISIVRPTIFAIISERVSSPMGLVSIT